MTYKIAVDCMGFENKPQEAVNAAIAYANKNPDLHFILVGDKSVIEPLITNMPQLTCHHTSEIITMEDTPLSARRKPHSSMHEAINLVASNQADAVVSAGSSGVYVALTYIFLGKLHDKIKPGFMPWVPTKVNGGFYFLDVGANKEYTGEELYYLALMANDFVKQTTPKKDPRIGLLNIGTESFKGFEFHQSADQLLKADKRLNYLGFLEPRLLIEGVCDILVSDGYSGNLVLKTLEGALKSVSGILKAGYKKNVLAALFSLNIIKKISRTFNYKNNAGAIILGLDKIALKTHGSADFKQFYSTIRMAHDTLKANFLPKLKADLQKLLADK
ncbi:phosphate acyltransferase PlsX [[Mycoplasma] testudinis]|uniref:phosphate acyltransferase PlsX n=1 Tax=[Mycoplasma] testudinis TaxID=33924 RepID=UPI000489FA8D|nr:phosphate acyltransferase PlsX [[Mycoplasma] testudinis]